MSPVEKYWDGAAWQDVFATAGYDTTPIGAVITHTSTIVPAGLLLANGQQVSELDYPDLANYAAIEVGRGNPLWAISGATPSRTITLPDLRDRFLYNSGVKALGLKSQANPALANPGEETHLQTPSEAALRAHNHVLQLFLFISRYGSNQAVADAVPYVSASNGWSGLSAQPPYASQIDNVAAANAAAATNNMPPYCVLAFFIKVKGIVAPAGVAVGPTGPPGGSVYAQVIGDGVATNFTVDHSFATRSVTVSIYRNIAPFDEIEADIERTSTSRITIRTMPTVPAIGEYTVLIAAAGQQATLNITMDGWHTVGAPGEPAFQNGWVNYGAPYLSTRFRKYPDGRVRIAGIVKSGTLNQPVFTLPPGYRPPGDMVLTVWTGATTPAGAVTLRADGSVICSTSSTYQFLDGIEFDTEAVLQTASVAAQPLDAWHLIGGVGEPPFQNSWANYLSGTYESGGFRKDPTGRVALKGLIKNGIVNATIFTLPVGYRPKFELLFAPSNNANTTTDLRIKPDGTVILAQGINTWLSLDGIEFDTELVTSYATGVIEAPMSSDTWMTSGPGIAGAWADLGVVNRTITFDGKTTIEIRGSVRLGGNTVGAWVSGAIGMDGAPGAGGAVEVVTGSVIANGAGAYITAPLFGWYTPAAGTHNFKLYGYANAGLANMDGGRPSFVAFYRRAS